MKEKDVTLADDAEETISNCGNRNISISSDGIVTQVFEKNAEDALAPLVYRKNGMKAGGERAWYLTYKETYVIPGDGSAGSGSYGTRTVTKYFSYDAKVKDIQQYAKNGEIELYPYWLELHSVSFDSISLHGLTNPNASVESYASGDIITLAPITETYEETMSFNGWSYQFGNGSRQTAKPAENDESGNVQIDTTGHTGTKTQKFKIKLVKTDIGKEGLHPYLLKQ